MSLNKVLLSVIGVALVIAAIYMLGGHRGKTYSLEGGITPPRVDATATRSSNGSPSNGSSQRGGAVGRRIEVKTILPPDGDAQTVINSLKSRAEAGDATASLQIFLKIRECMSELSPVSAEDRAIRRKARIAEPSLEEAEKALKNCEGLQRADYSERGKWLELAADNGSLEAQLLYAADSESIIGGASDRLKDPDKVKRYKLKTHSFLENAANQGSVEALMDLSNSYEKGIYEDRNLINAYAYYKAAQMAEPRILAADVLRSYENQLSPSELERGKALANTIYEKCCK